MNEHRPEGSAGFIVRGWSIWALLGALVFPGVSFAAVTYDGDDGMNALIISGGGSGGACTDSCHGAASPGTCAVSNAASVSQIAWLDNTNATQRYNSVVSCADEIVTMISPSAPSLRMPSSGGFFSTAEIALFSTWASGSTPRSAAPTVATTAMTASFKDGNSAILRGTVDPNGATVTTTEFLWGIGSSTGSILTVSNPSGSGGSSVAKNIPGTNASRTISGLSCGTEYSFFARATNAVNTANGGTESFFTDACSNPTIVYTGPGATVGTRVAVSKGATFDESAIAAISGTDTADAGIVSWSIDQTATSGSVVLDSAFPLQFTYTAPSPLVQTNDQFDLILTDTDPGAAGGPNTAKVTVLVSVTPSAPQFKDAPGGTVVVSRSLMVTEDDSVATSIDLFAEDVDVTDILTWTIPTGVVPTGGNPAGGMLGALNNATGTTNSISYTPNPDRDTNDVFKVRVSDTTTPVELTVNVIITPSPDNPTADDDGPVTFDVGVPVAISVLVSEGGGDLGDRDVDTGDVITVDPTSITSPTTGVATAVNSNTQIEYTSGATQFTADAFQYRVIDTTMRTSNLATVTLTPRDSDGDGTINYLDNCAASSNPGQADNDNDSGMYVMNNNLGDPADPNIGGDICDADDDNDGMPDQFEMDNGFDPFNAADASEDVDGDGVTNLQEFINDTSPTQFNIVIDATGYLTTYDLDLMPPEPSSIHSLATAVTPFFKRRPTDSSSITGPYRPGDNTITWRPSNDLISDLALSDPGGMLSDPPEQPFFIRPLVSFGVNQQVEENSVVTVRVRLNGDSPSWSVPVMPPPATVNYTLSGTANNPTDHDAAAVVVNFAFGVYEQDISFNVLTDAITDPNETIVFTLTGATNAVIGSKNTHTATIVEGNVAPRVALQFKETGAAVGSTYETGMGAITIEADASDVNSAQISTLSYDWSGTDIMLGPPIVTNVPTWSPAIPGAGTYLIDVVVTDSGAASTRISRILHIAAGAAPGILTDLDGNGIPDFLDVDADGVSLRGGNLIPDQTVDLNEMLLLETEPGLSLRRGSTTLAANRFGALLTPSDIESFGSVNGTAPVNAEDDFEHVGGIYDFEIHGLISGSSARIVIPLQSGIPKDAVYRKFNPSIGWSSFVVDNNNQVASAVGDLGACPEPGSSAYRNGLQYLDNCIQLTIKDGGPNDTDNTVNGVINDPSTVGVTLKDPELEEVEDGSGRVSPLLLAILLSLVGFAFWRRKRGFNID